MSIFNKEPKALTQETYKVAGMHYHIDNAHIAKLLKPNKIYRNNKKIISAGRAMQRIFKYDIATLPAKLVAEKHNEYDKNAVAVYVSHKHIGYIPADSAPHVRELMKKRIITDVTVRIGGGEYKVVSLNGEGVTMDGDFYADVLIFCKG